MGLKMRADFTRLRQLLAEQERFPTAFPVKFIGKNTPNFETSVLGFEREHPAGLNRVTRRMSAGGNHIALTYDLVAQSPDHVIAVLERVSAISDVVVIL